MNPLLIKNTCGFKMGVSAGLIANFPITVRCIVFNGIETIAAYNIQSDRNHSPDSTAALDLLHDPEFRDMILEGRDALQHEQIIRALSYLEDTVEALRESESRYRLLAMTVTDMISRHTPDGKFTFVTPSARAILGYEPNELLGHSNYGLIHPDDHDQINQVWQGILHSPHVFTATYRMLHRNGSYVWLETTTHLIRDPQTDEPVEIIAVARDISARVAAEQTLKEALRKERELSELKSRFISVASHEFRTPLSVILTSTDTLTAYRSRLDDEQIDIRLDRIRQQVRHLNAIVEDVLSQARAQAGLIEFVPLKGDLDALVREIVEDFTNRAESEQRLRYASGESPIYCDFDSRLMRQIIMNLLSNAVKYSDPTTTVEVELERRADTVILRVRDSGIGIPDDDLKYLFEPFHRSSNVGAIPGTGLGLNITYLAVERHGGTIHFDSAPGKGTTVTVTFPLAGP